MKIYQVALCFLCSLALWCEGSQHQVTIRYVTMPTYYNKTSPVRYVTKPMVGWDLTSEFVSYKYDKELFVGKGDMKVNINLISRYKLKVNFKQDGGHLDIITKDTKKNGKFTIKEVVMMTVKAIRMDNPNKSKLTIFIDGVAYKEENNSSHPTPTTRQEK